MNFKSNIETMRKNFMSKKPHKDMLRRQPFWTYSHLMNTQYVEQKNLIQSGQIYYASLIQANTKLFKFGFSNQGIEIIYSIDSYFDSNPQELAIIARYLYSYKNNPNPPQEIKEIIKTISNEYLYFFNTKLPLCITNNREIYITTLIAHRHHLPGKKLTNSIFPIIAKPLDLKPCMILPSHYWTKEFIDNF